MKKLLILCLFVAPALPIQAQFRKLLKSAQDRVESNVSNKTNKTIDGVFEGKKKPKTAEADNKEQQAQSAPTATASVDAAPGATSAPAPVENKRVASYSKFDFVPGDRVIYHEDFASDNIGEQPYLWKTNGKGEVVTLEKLEGKWMRMFTGANYESGNKMPFGENFTIEFDVLMEGTPSKSTPFFPMLTFGFYEKQPDSSNRRLKNITELNNVLIRIQPSAGKDSRMAMESMIHTDKTFVSDLVSVPTFNETVGKIAHYAVNVQKKRVRFWINERKVFDATDVVNLPAAMNQIFFRVEQYNFYDETTFGLYITNLKIASGLPDSRHKLIDEGRFSTSGILFALNSDQVQPQSYGIIKEIAEALKANPSVRVKVIGHTSNDGNAVANMDLSKRRAASVKSVLAKEYGIDESRIDTDGKGQTEPVSDNKTPEGRAENRRVEFVKL